MTTWLEIDSFALIHNIRKAREAIGEGISIFAVVKANAYGHGLAIAAEAFWRGGVDGFLGTETRDALELVTAKYRVPILFLQPPEIKDASELIRHNVRLAGVSLQSLELFEQAGQRAGMKPIIHLEVETGMHRLGVAMSDVMDIITQAKDGKRPIIVEGLFTHLYAPEDRKASEMQIGLVANFLFELQQKNIPSPFVHVLASRGALVYPQALYDAVRLGHAIYGLDSDYTLAEPAMTWKSTTCLHVPDMRLHMKVRKRSQLISGWSISSPHTGARFRSHRYISLSLMTSFETDFCC